MKSVYDYILYCILQCDTYAFSACASTRVGGRSPAPWSPGRESFLAWHRRNAGAVPGVQWSGDQSIGQQTDQQHGVYGTGGTCHERLYKQRGTDVRWILPFHEFFWKTTRHNHHKLKRYDCSRGYSDIKTA